MSIPKMLETGRQTPMVPLGVVAVFPSAVIPYDATVSNWQAAVAPMIPTAFVGIASSSPTNKRPTVSFPKHEKVFRRDTTAGEEGVIVNKGLYHVRVFCTVGDASGGGGTANSFEISVTTKNPAVSNDLWLSSPSASPYIPTAGVAASTAARAATDATFQMEGFYECAADDTVVQLVARCNTNAVLQLKSCTMYLCKIGNSPEATLI